MTNLDLLSAILMILSFTDNLQTLILICLVRVLEFQMKSLCSLYVV